MIVVDANVIAYRFIEGEKTNLACRVQEKDGKWIVPSLWRHEFLNVLATATRADVIATVQALAIWRSAIRVLSMSEHDVNFEKALSCAIDFRVSAYDAQYIILAQTLNCLVVTEDSRMLNVFPKIARSMRSFLEI